MFLCHWIVRLQTLVYGYDVSICTAFSSCSGPSSSCCPSCFSCYPLCGSCCHFVMMFLCHGIVKSQTLVFVYDVSICIAFSSCSGPSSSCCPSCFSCYPLCGSCCHFVMMFLCHGIVKSQTLVFVYDVSICIAFSSCSGPSSSCCPSCFSCYPLCGSCCHFVMMFLCHGIVKSQTLVFVYDEQMN